MKIILVIFCLMALNFNSALAQMSEVPELKKSLGIELYVGNGWNLNIMPNGSGSLGYGSLPTDVGFFPEGTLDYDSLYEHVTPLLKKDNTAFKKSSVAVIITKKGQTSYSALYFKGAEYWNNLLGNLKGKMTAYNEERFKSICSSHPRAIAFRMSALAVGSDGSKLPSFACS